MTKLSIFSFFIGLLCFSTISLHAQINEAQDKQKGSGKVIVRFNKPEALVIINNKFADAYFIRSGDTLTVREGMTSIKLSVINDVLFEQRLLIKKDSLYSIQHEFVDLPLTASLLDGNYAARKKLNATLLILTDANSRVIVNGKETGSGNQILDAPRGQTDVSVITSGKKSFTKNVEFNNAQHTLTVKEVYIHPEKSVATYRSFIPGLGQAYKKQKVKAATICISMGLATASFISSNLVYQNDKDEFDDLSARYNTSNNTEEITRIGSQLQSLESDLNTTTRIRNGSLIALAGIYLFQLTDGIFSKPNLPYRQNKPLELFIEQGVTNNVQATVRWSIQ